jgi:hypothetical protein
MSGGVRVKTLAGRYNCRVDGLKMFVKNSSEDTLKLTSSCRRLCLQRESVYTRI